MSPRLLPQCHLWLGWNLSTDILTAYVLMKLVTPFPSQLSNHNLAPLILFQETIPIITFLADNFRCYAHLNPSLCFPLLFCMKKMELFLQCVFFLGHLHLTSHPSDTLVLPVTSAFTTHLLSFVQTLLSFHLCCTTKLSVWSWYILFPSSNWLSCPLTAKCKSQMELWQSVLRASLWRTLAPSSNCSSVFWSKKSHGEKLSSVVYWYTSHAFS